MQVFCVFCDVRYQFDTITFAIFFQIHDIQPYYQTRLLDVCLDKLE